MPQLGAITVNDGKTTPASHTFAPVKTDGSNARLANRSAAVPQGYEILEINVRDVGTSKTAAYRVFGSMTLPTLATVGDVVSVDHFSKVDFSFNFSQLSTAQERKDLLAMLSNLFAHADMKTVVTNIEPLY
jgi:hypothetical protein